METLMLGILFVMMVGVVVMVFAAVTLSRVCDELESIAYHLEVLNNKPRLNNGEVRVELPRVQEPKEGT